MTSVLLGNVGALENGQPLNVGNTITLVEMRENFDSKDDSERALSTNNDRALNVIRAALEGPYAPAGSMKYAIGLLEVNDLWSTTHSDDPPEWIESDDKKFAEVLSYWFSKESHESVEPALIFEQLTDPLTAVALRTWLVAGSREHSCPVGRPNGWASLTDYPPLGGGAVEFEHLPLELQEDYFARLRIRELLTTVGRDALHSQHLNTSAPPATFNYMCVSANATAESAGNTTLPGEITTAGGGLLRRQATYAHTGGTNTSTLTSTFTANGSDSLPVTIAKIGVLNAASVGTLGYEKLLASTATLTISGDNVAITWTLTGA